MAGGAGWDCAAGHGTTSGTGGLSPSDEGDAQCCSAVANRLRFLERVEDLAIEQVVAELRIEAFARAVLPWAGRRDIGCPGAHRAEFASFVRAARDKVA